MKNHELEIQIQIPIHPSISPAGLTERAAKEQMLHILFNMLHTENTRIRWQEHVLPVE
jgi:hypothetical protein